MLLVGSATVAPAGVNGVTGGAAVIVDGTNPIATTDEDFVCATLDWWPPEKCDYGTCAWGLASMLNLVSVCLLFLFHLHFRFLNLVFFFWVILISLMVYEVIIFFFLNFWFAQLGSQSDSENFILEVEL